MADDRLTQDLYNAICDIPLIDPHSHIDPHKPASRTLDDILGYHYYTELAHSAGMDKGPLAAHVEPRQRVRSILGHMERFDNTVQYSWFLEIARTFLNFRGDRLTAKDADSLWTSAERLMAQPDWADQVLRRSNVEKVFLTNDFDDPLKGFDTSRYVPCLRTDDLVFHLHRPEVRQRLARATNVEVGDAAGLRQALTVLFDHFTRHGARACAISLPPDFQPRPVAQADVSASLARLRQSTSEKAHDANDLRTCGLGIFWMLAEFCRAYKLPFDLMIGVNRRVFRDGVHQGQDLFDQRTSLIQYAELFNDFPTVTFPISVLTSVQNQELVSYSWIFPNVITHGHWWYSNTPAYIEHDLRGRLHAVPKTKQIGYYSDAYKLEFILPKYNTYRRILAQVLANDYVKPHVYTEAQALDMGRLLLRDNAQRIFHAG